MKIFYTKTILLIAIFTISSVAAKAQQTDELLNLLIKKNLVSQQEADSLRSELALKEQAKRDKDKANQHSITIGSKALQISGLVQSRYQGFEQSTVNNAFDLHRARLDAKGSVTDKWSYEVYAEFAGTARLLDAYTAYQFADYLKITAGQFKIPFSYESLTSDSQLEFIDRSQVIEALAGRSKDVIGNQNGRDIGIQVGGSFAKLEDRYLFDYTLGIFNGAGYNATTDNNGFKDFVGRIGVHPVKGLDLGGSLYSGEGVPSGGTKSQYRSRYGFDARYILGALSLTAEYAHGTDAAVKRDGWYAQAGYYIIPQIQLVSKYDTYDPNKVITTDRAKIYTGGVNFVFNKYTKLAVDYLDRREETATQVKNNIFEAQLQIAF